MFKLPAQPEVIAAKLKLPSQRVNLFAAVQNFPARFFCPNGAQEEYINTVAHCTKDTKIPVVLVTFANGVGKTTATVNIVENLVSGPLNGWFDQGIFKHWTFPKLIWYASTPEAIADTVDPMFDYFERNADNRSVMFRDGKSHPNRRVWMDGGWELRYKTFDQDPKKYESANVGLFIADEPMPEELWKAAKSRRRKGCVTLLPMTPLYCPPYIVDEIQSKVIE